MSFAELWRDAEWRTTVEQWIAAALESLGLEQSAELTPVQSRPWSVVLQVPTQAEIFYFKASAPGLRHEPAITSWLASQFPDLVADVLAVELQAGWMLQRSAGERLRESAADIRLSRSWRELLPAYGNMQSKLATRADQLLAIGLPDRRPGQLPAHLRRWRRQFAQSSAADNLLTPAEVAALESIQIEVEAVCRQLAASPPASSINHGDLHDGNVGLTANGFRIFDWGDASLSHPFFSLRSTFVSLESRLGWPEGDQRFDELMRIYISAWREDHAIGELERVFAMSRKVWSIATALSWEAALQSAPASTRSEYNHVLPSLMRELLLAFDKEIDQPI